MYQALLLNVRRMKKCDNYVEVLTSNCTDFGDKETYEDVPSNDKFLLYQNVIDRSRDESKKKLKKYNDHNLNHQDQGTDNA